MNFILGEQPPYGDGVGMSIPCVAHEPRAMQLLIDVSRQKIAPELRSHFGQYLSALLAPDVRAAIQVTGAYVRSHSEIATWWEQIIQPAMYVIGDLWARGWISVGQEHLATAITQRVMAAYYPLILELPRRNGPIVLSASRGEHHEIGLRIVADLFEIHGWDVLYVGADTPAASTVGLLEQTGAQFLCISTTLVQSLPAVRELIAQVRAANLQPGPKILLGGQAYLTDRDLWREVGADWFAATPHDGLAYLDGARP